MRSDAALPAPLPLAAWALERLAGGDNSPAALLCVPAAAAAREARDDRHPDPVDWPPSQVEGVEAAGDAIPAVVAAGDAIPAAGVVGVASIPAVMGVETIAGPASAAVVHRASPGPQGIRSTVPRAAFAVRACPRGRACRGRGATEGMGLRHRTKMAYEARNARTPLTWPLPAVARAAGRASG